MPNMSDAKVSLGAGRAIKETEKAVLIETKEHAELWVPKSQIHDDSEVFEEGTSGRVVVRAWWARKEGLM